MYFAKYIPVEGTIEKGSPYRMRGSGEIRRNEGDAVIEWCHVNDLKYQFVKLCICSRDIQITDTVFCFKDPDKRYHTAEGFWEVLPPFNSPDSLTFNNCYYIKGKFSPFYIPTQYVYKVIGEIKPECDWVEEGDEFNKEDLIANGVGVNWNDSYGKFKFNIKRPI